MRPAVVMNKSGGAVKYTVIANATRQKEAKPVVRLSMLIAKSKFFEM